MKRTTLVLSAFLIFTAALLAKGCASSVPNRNPLGEAFPQVVGESFDQETVELPARFAGEPTILLLGYERKAQFDINRWVMGLMAGGVEAEIVEVPTVSGWKPSAASRWIDDDMRAAVPAEEWGAVVTLLGESAQPVTALTGTERGRLTRVVLLDGEGKIAWFDDKGFSPRKAMVLIEEVRAMRASTAGSDESVSTSGASTERATRYPEGEPFPVVVGQSLEEQTVEIPTDFSGAPVVLLVGYEQSAQFDIDRWIIGLMRAEVQSRIVELPTIPGFLASLASGWIDDGMRSGIPREDWSSVVTLYGKKARPVAELTGTDNGNVARVFVLDATGTIVWFDDEGFGDPKPGEIAALLGQLENP